MLPLHRPPPGMWCVPTALYTLTGADIESVIHPALNRHGHDKSRPLTGLVVGSSINAAIATLMELGYSTRRYKHNAHRLSTWQQMSTTRYPDRTFLLGVPGHVLVAQNGRIYDTYTPHGASTPHPYATALVTTAYLVEPRHETT